MAKLTLSMDTTDIVSYTQFVAKEVRKLKPKARERFREEMASILATEAGVDVSCNGGRMEATVNPVLMNLLTKYGLQTSMPKALTKG